MKIYLSFAVLSVAVGACLGALTPADQIPEDLARFDERQPNATEVMRLGDTGGAASAVAQRDGV